MAAAVQGSLTPTVGRFRSAPRRLRQTGKETPGNVSSFPFSVVRGSAKPERDLELGSALPRPSFLTKKGGPVEVVPPPRICTLRRFSGENSGGGGSSDPRSQGGELARIEPETVSSFFASLAANVEFSLNIQTWEILSGRLAMIVFACAVAVEGITGNTLFEKVDMQRVEELVAAGLIAIFGAAGFAFAWGAKFRVMGSMSKGAENLVNSFIDNIIDSLFFDDNDDCNHFL